MSQLFDRKVRLTVLARLGSVSTNTSGQRFNVFTQSATIEDLRVVFDINKTLKPDSNKAKITVYNLSKESRGLFQQKPVRVIIEAGYGDTLGKLYEGDVMAGSSKREGPDWLTDLQMGTGHDAMKHARSKRSFKIGADPKKMIAEIAGDMGLKMPTNFGEGKELFERFSSGVNLNGLSTDQMTKLLKPQGFGWSNQDGRLQILTANGVSAAPAIIISQDHGMVGSPELVPPSEKGKPPILEAKMLLEPDLSPGGLVQVRSRDIQSNFKVLTVRHTGDTHEAPWYSEIEGRHL